MYYQESSSLNSAPVAALSEFQEAWNSKDNFNYKNDELEYYQEYLVALYDMAELRLTEARRKTSGRQHLQRMLEVSNRALQLKPDDLQVRLQTLRAHFALQQLFRGQGSPEERRLYDDSARQVTTLLAAMLEEPGSAELYRIAALKSLLDLKDTVCQAGPLREAHSQKALLYRQRYYTFLSGRQQAAPEIVTLPAEIKNQMLRCKSSES
jgi:hypothetical protein